MYYLAPDASEKLRAILDAFEANGVPVTGGPDNLSTICPNHEDIGPSLSVADGKKGVIFKCHAGCDQDEVFHAVAKFTGLNKKDFFYEEKNSPSNSTGPVVTVAELASAKMLPVEIFTWAGIRDSPQGILIPYWDVTAPPRVRVRKALKASNGSYWQKSGTEKLRITAYGAWRVPFFSPGGILYFVEGETDALTGWWHGLPVLGFPGKATARKILAKHPKLVAGIYNIFVVEEPDDFKTRDFLRGVKRGLTDLGWSGQVFSMRLPEKDLSDLHVKRGPVGFWSAFMSARETAVDAPTWPDPLLIPPAAVKICTLITTPDFPATFRIRDVQRRMRATSSTEIRAVLGLLEQANVVRRLPAPRRVGRPAEWFRTNPKLRL